jgi:hypothetical protein
MGIGDWGLGIGPNPQSPIPNPQTFFPNFIYFTNISFKKIVLKNIMNDMIYEY